MTWARQLGDLWRARRVDVVVAAGRWPTSLETAFPGRRQVVEAWTGEGAAFARYRTPHGPQFLKYLPAGWRDEGAFHRLQRESAYLRDLAPLSPVPHAPHLHSALHRPRWQAHLLTRDLTDETTGWGAFQTDEERERGLLDVVRLLARHHAFWAGSDGQGHAALRGEWAWHPERLVRQAGRMAAQEKYVAHRAMLQEVAAALPGLLARQAAVTLAHGDIHAGQVLWPRTGQPPALIDYGQIHSSVLGEDMAHLLVIRLNAEERARLGPALRAAYLDGLAEHGLAVSPARWTELERAGLAVNLLTTVRQVVQRDGSGVRQALNDVAQAWYEDQP